MLLIATVAWRLLGVRAALVALGAAVLTYQEHGAPIWLWLAVLVLLALERAAPAGRLRRFAAWARAAALALLALALVPFVITQARLAVYPQLEALGPVSYSEPVPEERSRCSTRPRARAWRETSAPGQVAPRSAPCQRRPRSCRYPRSP